MKHSERLAEIEERWKAFKHWHTVRPEIQPTPYDETAGPDVEYLLARIKRFTEIVEEVAKYPMLAQYVDTSDRNQSKIYWTNLTIKARAALEGV